MRYSRSPVTAAENYPVLKKTNRTGFSDQREQAAAQLKMQSFISNSSQATAQQQLQMKAVDSSTIQRKLQRWDNTLLSDQERQVVPATAKSSVGNAAIIIDNAVEEGADIVRTLWAQYQITGDSNELYRKLKKKSPPNAGRYIRNFINRITDSVLKKKPYAPAKEAGYIIEAFANKAARDAGIETQVTIGTARPDFRHQTGEQYQQDSGIPKAADGLIDATSAAEAAKGHILSKMAKMAIASARMYPTLYDCYYDDLGLGTAPQKVKLNPKVVKMRLEKFRHQQEMARWRKQSLRERKKVNYR